MTKQTETNSTPTPKEIKRMERKINSLRAKAREAGVDAKAAFKKQMKFVDIYQDLVAVRMKSASLKVGKMGDELEEGITRAWSELQASYDRASKLLH